MPTPRTSRFQLNEQVERPKDSKRTSGDRACPANDSTGRCKKQSIRWINDSRASIFLTPDIFFELFANLLSESHDKPADDMDRERHIQQRRLMSRWNQHLELLYLDFLKSRELGHLDHFGNSANFSEKLTAGKSVEKFFAGLQPFLELKPKQSAVYVQNIVDRRYSTWVLSPTLAKIYECHRLKLDLMSGWVNGAKVNDQAEETRLYNLAGPRYRECLEKIPHE